MTTGTAILVLTAFLACAVEAVEALTVVLAVGVTRGRCSSLVGSGTATLALAAVIAALGPALSLMPSDALRVLVGTLLLVFGWNGCAKRSGAPVGIRRFGMRKHFTVRNS
jgi:uncharacterized membrane protein